MAAGCVRARCSEGSDFRFDGAEGKSQQISAIQRGDQSEVTWQMQADMGLNPIARITGLFLDRMIGPTFDRGLENMAAEFAAT